MLDLGLFIDGERVDATSGETFDSVNPATGEVLARVGQASQEDVDRAVASAAAAFVRWSAMPAAQRARILHRAAGILRERNDEIARMEVLDTGKPISEAIGYDVDNAADTLEFLAGVARTIHGEHMDFGGSFSYTRREPLGVCAGIGAWNYPFQIATWKSAPALACGNTMIFKPAELTPVSALLLADVYAEAGVPPGVFNVVQGDHRVGEMLTRHPGIAKVSLTGEVGTGKKVMAAAATTLKEVTLELGGKSPLIVFADADLDDAVSAALLANFYTQGEVCSNGTRVFVERAIHDEFMSQLRSRTEKMVIGDPLDPATHVGALISQDHMEKVLGYVQLGVESGANLVIGGRRAAGDGLDDGFFVEPAVFDGCTDDMRIVQEEIFGPVMAVLTFDTEDEVVTRANDTHYGLAAGLFTKDLARAHRVAAALEAGNVWINTYNITPPEVPFGGYKQSGIGRENSAAVVDHYTQRKTVYVGMEGIESPY
ncbi:MAG TPA: betaine-aldehyde dehydrogenase [Acidimicrobiia bacterium]|jgi:betaine-aldehyde dehydrogenase|nr:betaine-aldehyde dehydrogenase [Acidimicrobiia bacterium]